MTHKKRGRPPLKAEEGQARRPYETSIGPLNAPGLPAQGIPGYGEPTNYAAQGGLADSRPLPSPGPVETRRRPPPLFQPFQGPPQSIHGQHYVVGQLTPSGNRPRSTESSLSSNRPPSPYYTNRPSSPYYISPPLHSPAVPQMPQSRLDLYGRSYPPGPSGYSTLAPTSAHRSSPHLQQYQSIAPVSSAAPPPIPLNPSSFPGQQGPASNIQLPPIQPIPAPPGPPRTSHSDPRGASTASTYPPQPGPQSGQQSEDISSRSHDAKRQRMDLGGMLRRSET